jgi:hypothetical protein
MMMEDILAERNQKKGEELGSAAYRIEIVDENNFSTATVSIILPTDLSGQPISDI